VRFTSPPTILSGMQRDLPDVILEMLSARIDASDPVQPVNAYRPPEPSIDDNAPPQQPEPEQYSERDACVLALLDSLPYLEESILVRWLEVAASFVAGTAKTESKEMLRGRFWDVISGELDVGRSQLAIPWWSEGGRDTMLGLAVYT